MDDGENDEDREGDGKEEEEARGDDLGERAGADVLGNDILIYLLLQIIKNLPTFFLEL